MNQPQKTIDVYYVTDPMCSHCWAIEPVLRQFQKTVRSLFPFPYGDGWFAGKRGDGPVDPANGIYGPADVTKHWREVGEQTRMPIDGSLMQDNPVQSSYPASRVFKVIQNMHGDDVASTYLRRTREAVFAFNRNISDKEVLVKIVDDMGLEGEKIVTQAEEPSAQKLLNEDFQQARNLGAMGFPSILMINEEKKGIKIVGGRPLDAYIQGLKQVLGVNELEPKEQPTLTELLAEEELLFSKEIEVMYDVDQTNIASFIDEHLNSEQYDENELLGEKYIQIK